MERREDLFAALLFSEAMMPNPSNNFDISQREDVSDADKKRAQSEYGDVTYADPKNKKYPIDTEEHIRAAWGYISHPNNASKYSASEVAEIKKRIVAAWKSKINKEGPPSASEHSAFGLVRVIDEFTATKAGEPYRLLPYGTLYKDGVAHEITPEWAKDLKLPQWMPAIKLGSHADSTPAGGFILSLEPREDGVWAYPEYLDSGEKALQEGAFRYHSPEILWEGAELEDPVTGKMIPGPFIIGDALLHYPHLGQGAALFEFVPQRSETMSDQISVPKNLWDRFTAFLEKSEKGPTPEQLTAITQERDALAAKVKKADEEQKKAAEEARVNALKTDLAAELKKDEYSAFKNGKPEDGAAMLATMNEDQRKWVLTALKAAAAQVKAGNILGEVGSAQEGGTLSPDDQLDAAIQAYSREHKCDYVTAMAGLRSQHPEFFAARAATMEQMIAAQKSKKGKE